jgi:hypothetical protein
MPAGENLGISRNHYIRSYGDDRAAAHRRIKLTRAKEKISATVLLNDPRALSLRP